MRRIIQFSLILSLVITALYENIQAVPAKPGPLRIANGNDTITVFLHGDENFHYCLSEDGYLLTDNNGVLDYATVDGRGALVSTGIRATPVARRTPGAAQVLAGISRQTELQKLSVLREAGIRKLAPHAQIQASATAAKGLFPGAHFPAHGEQKALVVLVEYANVGFTLDDPADYFTRLLNEPGFADYGGTGSAKDYFMENSMGRFRPQFDVFGPVKLTHDRSYYGGNDFLGNDRNAHEMVIEACQQLDGTVDFSQYDRDGDGYIDNVFIFYAGRGEASGGTADTVWPHSWNITKASSTPYIFDGVQLDYYACTNEWTGSRPDGIGTFVHEFSHVMGLPDLYATTNTSTAFTPGDWSVMDHGPYNNSGCTPPMYSAFERYAVGWAEPIVVDKAQNATLPPLSTNTFAIIPTPDSNEYFLLENRQQTSWDQYIPGHGMLVWHVDYDATVWTANRVNNNAAHQYVDIEEADGQPDAGTRAADAFPGTNGITSFTDDTAPSMLAWNGSKLNTPLTEITEDTDGIIRFKVKGGREPLAPAHALPPANIGATEFTARWEAPTTTAATYRLKVYRKTDGNPADIRSYTVSDATAYTVGELQPDTYYYYTVEVTDALEVSAPSEEIELFTGHLTIDHFKVTARQPLPSSVSEDSFTAQWEPLEDAVEYHLTVYTKKTGDPLADYCGFDNKLDLPQGWSTNSTSTYSMASYAGSSTPSLRLGNGQWCRTPRYDAPVKQVSFWHRGNSAGAGDKITVTAIYGDTRRTVASIAVDTSKGGSTATLSELPAETEAIEISYVAEGKGSLAIDDIDVRWGNALVPSPLDGYNAVSAGNSTEYRVENLAPETEYFYTVTATDGTYTSIPSDEIRICTGKTSGISSPAPTAAIQWRISGMTLEISASPESICGIYDVAGRLVGTICGSGSLTLPCRGIYILSSSASDKAKIRL